ncbi:hypothetical protein BH10PSE15_BH10PSE15_04320 [soil metagenome]
MSDDQTARLALPLLNAGQAQKEVTHNEALLLLDLFAQPVVLAIGLDTPPPVPSVGQCWILGAAPAGEWSGRANHIAGWSAGGWRFCPPGEGLVAWSVADAGIARYEAGAWRVASRQPAIAGPTDGSVIDAEARSTIAAILAALRAHDLIAS